MKIIGRSTLEEFKLKHADVRSHIDSWTAEVANSDWSNSMDIKARYSTASILGEKKVVFNLKSYRLLVEISYKNKIVYVKKIGKHDEYMKW